MDTPSGIDFSGTELLYVTEVGTDSLIEISPAALEVMIDIKPGSGENTINLNSAGVVPVAILSSASFDALEMDPDTIRLAGARVSLVGRGKKFLFKAQDSNGDGLADLMCQVETDELLIETGDCFAVLEGVTFNGVFIRDKNSIRIVPDE